jgi:hypothetical protein
MDPTSTTASGIHAQSDDRWVSPAEAAEILGVNVRLLAGWRLKSQGPRWRKYGGTLVNGKPVGGGLVRYKVSELKAFADACVIDARHADRDPIRQEVSV